MHAMSKHANYIFKHLRFKSECLTTCTSLDPESSVDALTYRGPGKQLFERKIVSFLFRGLTYLYIYCLHMSKAGVHMTRLQ